MVKSNARTVQEYLDELPKDRRLVMEQVRDVIRRNLPEGYREAMNWGMITYEIPLERHPETYNGEPLGYVALAAQKNYYALYMMAAYQDSEQDTLIREGFAKAGKKLDMGKSCIRFRKLEDIPLEVIGESVASVAPDELIRSYERVRGSGSRKKGRQ